jgi:hypothetical protein
MPLKEMDQDTIRELLKGHDNLITPLANSELAVISKAACPQCGSQSFQQVVNPRNPFSTGAVTPNTIATCLACNAEFNPKSGFLTKA